MTRFDLIFLLSFCTVLLQLAASAPLITPEDEVVFKAGTNFQLVCEANKPVEWKLPTISVRFLEI